MISFEDFKTELLKRLSDRYSNTRLENNETIVIVSGAVEAIVTIEDVYRNYSSKMDFELIYEFYVKILEDEFGKFKFKVDYDKVYPFIKTKDFAKDENLELIRDHHFLNLDVLYVMDSEASVRFILKGDDVDLEKLKKSAHENLNSITMPLLKIDKSMEIYSAAFENDYAASLILTESFINQVRKKVGDHFLFILPSAPFIFVAKPLHEYIDILNSFIKMDPDQTLSNRVYRYRYGKYEYAENSSILRLL